jgi:urease accessory protein
VPAGGAIALAALDAGQLPQVDLTFQADTAGRTWMLRQRAAYPFHVGRSWYLPGDPGGMLTLYVQSCSGGLFQQDVLAWRLTAKEGARAHVTSSASTIVHTMDRGDALQTVEIEAAAGSLVEYLPDPLILFPRARLSNLVRVRVHPEAAVMLWDGVVSHDPGARGRMFDWLFSELVVSDPLGVVLACDRYRLEGEAFGRSQPGGMHGYACQGSFLVLQRSVPQRQMVDAVRAALPAGENVYAGATRLPAGENVYAGATRLPADCGTWVRVLARDAVGLREALRCAWYAARKTLTGNEPAHRRK